MSVVLVSFNPLISNYFQSSNIDPDLKVLLHLLCLCSIVDDYEIDTEVMSKESKIDHTVITNALFSLAQSGIIQITIIPSEEDSPCTTGSNSTSPKSLSVESLEVPSNATLPLPPQWEKIKESNAPTNSSPNPLEFLDDPHSGLSPN
jgi:hypothetical protein